MSAQLAYNLAKLVEETYPAGIPVHTTLAAIETLLCGLFEQEDTYHIITEMSGMTNNIVFRVQDAKRKDSHERH